MHKKTREEHVQILAQYIYDSDVQHIDYSDHCEHNQDPREHILWSAAEVLGLVDSEGFAAEFQVWEDKQTVKKRKQGTW
jgi:hypothetical protein